MKSGLLGVVCFVVTCITLSLGLWPFHGPRNEVTWLKKTNGLAFGKYGTVLSAGPLKDPARDHTGGTVEIWLQPARWTGATLLSLYRPEKNILFTLHQSLTDLEVRDEFQDDKGSTLKPHFYVDDAFAHSLQKKQPVFITVTSDERGTTVYLDGVPARTVSSFRIPAEAFTGRLILGDSPWQPDSFPGQIRGLAIYDRGLNAGEVLHHCQEWIGDGKPDRDESIVALYLFSADTGNTVHNSAASNGDLNIPSAYRVVDKLSLEPVWSEFNFSGTYWRGALKNIIGFVPFGFCFYAFFLLVHPVKKPVLMTVFLGFLASLTIEVLQAFLPTRDSGTTDLITNTFGTYLGVLSYIHIYPAVVKKYPWLGWFLSS